MDYINKKFTMGDGTVFLVVEQVDYLGRTYLLIVNREDEDDLRFVEIKGDLLVNINPILFSKIIYPLFKEKFSK